MKSKLWISLLSFLLFFSFSSLALAKEINLYDQPKDGAKVLGKIDLAAGIIPIFTPKDSTWMKVGDPRNGDVGWVKGSEIQGGAGASVTFTQQIVNDGKGPHTYQIMQFGEPSKMTNEEAKAALIKMQAQQKTMQDNFQKIFRSMMDDMNVLQQQLGVPTAYFTPVITPIVIMPAQNTQPAGTAKNNTKGT